MKRVLVSAPKANAVVALPVATYWAAVESEYMNPEQAADRSKAGQASPNRSCTRQAVEGQKWSGVNVPMISRSTSFGPRPAAASARFAASTHKSLVA